MVVIPFARREPEPLRLPYPLDECEVVDARSSYERLEDAVGRLERLADWLDRRLPR